MATVRIILKNSAKCLNCNDEVESTHVHDFKWCKCQSIAVDGGLEYTRRVANDLSQMEDTSEYADCPEYIWNTVLYRTPHRDRKAVFENLMAALKESSEKDRLKREEQERKQP